MTDRDYPTYEGCLAAAGANVLDFETFGSYQGDWWAKVTYNGQTGWIHGSYGSCSGCDALEAELGSISWDDDISNEEYQKRLADFGSYYLDNIMTQEDAIKDASKYLDWDLDANDMVKYLKENAL